MDYFKKIERSVTISADKRSTVDLQVDVWSQDLNVTKFILKLDTTDSAAIDLTNATVRVAMVYSQDGQDVKIEAAGIVEDVATQKIAYVMDDKLAGFEGLVIAGFYVTLNTGQRIDIQNVTFNMRKSLLDKDLEAATDNYYQTFDDIVADVQQTGDTAKTQIGQVLPDVQAEGEKVKTNINAVVSNVNGYADTQKQAIDNIVSDVQSTGNKAKEDIKATLPTLQGQVSELKSDLGNLESIIYENVTSVGTLFEFENGCEVLENTSAFYVGGKNLIHAEDFTAVTNGVTCNFSKGILSLNGTSSSNTSFFIPISSINTESGETYTFATEETAFPNNVSVSICKDKYGSKVVDKTFDFKDRDTLYNSTVSPGNGIYLHVYCVGEKIYNGSTKIMLLAGTQSRTTFEYSEMPVKYNSPISINKKGYVCVQSFDNIKVGYNVEKKATINNVAVEGNKTLEDFGIEVDASPIKRKYPIYNTDTSQVIVSETTSGASDNDIGKIYYAVQEREINDLFRYSEEMDVDLSSGPHFATPKSNNGYAIEFMFEGNNFSVIGYTGNFRFLVADDEKVLTEQVYQNPSPVTDGRAYTHITFNESIKKKIVISCSGKFYGIKTDGIISKFEHERLKLVVDGDSIVYGVKNNNSYTNTTNIFGQIAKAYDFDVVNTSMGGTGFVAKGTVNKNFADRIETNANFNPDIFIMMGGLNDRDSEIEDKKNGTTFVKDAILSYYSRIKAEIGAKYIIGISPFCPNADLGSLYPLEDIGEYCRVACAQNKIPYIDTLHGITYDALGSVISDNSNGFNPSLISESNRAEYISSDNVHPSKAGDRYIALRLIQEIWRVLYKEYGFCVE